jgi:hypothetical protein
MLNKEDGKDVKQKTWKGCLTRNIEREDVKQKIKVERSTRNMDRQKRR